LFFKNRHISSALAELIRSTRAPTKDRLIGKIMGGNPVFRGTRVLVHRLAELVPLRARAHALPEGKCRHQNADIGFGTGDDEALCFPSAQQGWQIRFEKR
jgi:hypothetical protein